MIYASTVLGKFAATDGLTLGIIAFTVLIITFPSDEMEGVFERLWMPLLIVGGVCIAFLILFAFLKIWGVN